MGLHYEKIGSDKIHLRWQEPGEGFYLEKYEIYSNDKLIGITLFNYFELTDLIPGSDYHIHIKVKTSSRYIPTINDRISIRYEALQGNVAFGKPVTASSEENSVYVKENITDGNSKTRWSSQAGSDTEWVIIDLLDHYAIDRIILDWEYSYAEQYQVDLSADGQHWKSVYSTTSGKSGVEDIQSVHQSGRYVRVLGIKRGSPWTYSLWGVDVYGIAASQPNTSPEGSAAMLS
nr:discoidin domain-containing protein [Paenibacillus lutrae]